MRKTIVKLTLGICVLLIAACENGSSFDISILYDSWQSQYVDGSGYTITYMWIFGEGVYTENYSRADITDSFARIFTGSMTNSEATVTIIKNTVSYSEDFIAAFNGTHSLAGLGYTFDLDADTVYDWSTARGELIELEMSVAVNNSSPISETEAESIVDEYRTQVFTFSIEGDTLTVDEDGEIYTLTRM